MTPPRLQPVADDAEPLPAWMAHCKWIKGRNNAPDRLAKTVGNAIIILGQSPDWKDKIQLDTFSGKVTLTDPPWPDHHQPSEVSTKRKRSRAISDLDVTRARAWLLEQYEISLAPADVHSSIGIVAEHNADSSPRRYMRNLKWDGVPRVETWLTTYMGVTDDKDGYARMVGRWWLIAGVARIHEPGVKVDNVLVLEGDQGLGKSSALRALASSEWFTDTPIDIGSKDAFAALRGKMIVELAEIDTVRRADVSATKAFFSSSVDHYRPAYGRYEIESPRQCIFAGTVNPMGSYLLDESGNRRFWPVLCGEVGRIDEDAIKADRDQLWAEAVAMYDKGERHYPRDAIEHDICNQHQQARAPSRDEWCDPIETWLGKAPMDDGDGTEDYSAPDPNAIKVSDVLAKALSIEKGRWTRADQTRVGMCMKALGYERYRIATGSRPWAYRKRQ